MASVTVETNQYEGAHGKKPRGYGRWMFTIAGEYVDFPASSYGVAKKAAIQAAKEAGETCIQVCS